MKNTNRRPTRQNTISTDNNEARRRRWAKYVAARLAEIEALPSYARRAWLEEVEGRDAVAVFVDRLAEKRTENARLAEEDADFDAKASARQRDNRDRREAEEVVNWVMGWPVARFANVPLEVQHRFFLHYNRKGQVGYGWMLERLFAEAVERLA